MEFLSEEGLPHVYLLHDIANHAKHFIMVPKREKVKISSIDIDRKDFGEAPFDELLMNYLKVTYENGTVRFCDMINEYMMWWKKEFNL